MLRYEQKRCGFLYEEIQKLKSINKESEEEQILVMLEQSNLLNYVQEVHSSFKFNRPCKILINKWLECTLQISLFESLPEVRHYYSLLFLENSDKIEQDLGPNSSSVLLLLLKHCKFPVKSFMDIHNEHEVPLKSLYRAAQHFIYWNKAKVVPALTSKTTLCIAQSWSYSHMLELEYSKSFKSLFGEFPETLQAFKSPVQMKDLVVNNLRGRKLIPVITWLLRKQVVQTLHLHVFLLPSRVKVPEEVKQFLQVKTPIPESLISQIIEQEQTEASWILHKVLKYCNGKFPLEEISWRSGVPEDLILNALPQFNSFLRPVLLP